jgi:nicotinamide mononucleotide adenylyltransferase
VEEAQQTVLFSGRFDPPHAGHVVTIVRLAKRFARVLVVILDDGKAAWPLSYRRDVLTEAMSLARNVLITSNRVHFAQVTREALGEWQFDVYAAGNPDVLRHIEALGIPCIYTERAYDFSATAYRLGCSIQSLVGGRA